MDKETASREGRSPWEAARSYFRRLTIARKMLLGYASLVVLLVIISVFALANLERLNSINKSILEKNVPVVKAVDRMLDAVLAQELYARRFIILRSPEIMKVFWERDDEFDSWLGQVRGMADERDFPVDKISRLHDEYTDILMGALEIKDDGGALSAMDFDVRVRESQEMLVRMLKGLANVALEDQNRKTGETALIGDLALKVAWGLCIVGVLFSLAAAMLITRNISGAIRELKNATEKISEGQFDFVPEISNKDELGDLAVAFVSMAKRLKRLEEMYLDASPLTHLAGGIAIENVLKKRIEAGVPFAFCLLDMDNFKAYNDRYGYAKGNAFIQALAKIVEKAVADKGGEEDFIGHVGGDDFVVITSPELAGEICSTVIDDFKAAAPWFYDEEDRLRGCIEGSNRQGVWLKFPLATISIAVVTNNNQDVDSHIRVGEIAAELKEYAKSIPGNMYVVDKRHHDEAGLEKEDPGHRTREEADG